MCDWFNDFVHGLQNWWEHWVPFIRLGMEGP